MGTSGPGSRSVRLDDLREWGKLMKTGCRIPKTYFVTSGVGQSDAQTGEDHYETSAYDIALLDGGIENFNVMMYTSVLPADVEEISIVDAEQRGLFTHGAVLETIKAQMEGVQGEHLCAGVGTCKVLVDDKYGLEKKVIGGFAAEYEGNASPGKAKKILEEDLRGIVRRRYGSAAVISDMTFHVRDMVVDEEYGLVFVALCFVEYEHPILHEKGE